MVFDIQPTASSLPADPTVPLELSAGPLSLIFENGWIRAVRLGGVEIVRRVYFALRDEFWNTIPGEIVECSLQRLASSFIITFNSRHRRGSMDFLWRAEITGNSSGEIGFSARGIAMTRFKKNRIGLCVLHPLSTCKGKPCRIETVDGLTEGGAFPSDIAPEPLFKNVRALSYAIASGLDATIWFEGDIFETEDQRNWTDATYKTYSTPISLPLPAVIEKGTLINQKVTIIIDKPTAALVHIPLSLQLDLTAAELKGRLPRLGVMETGCDPCAPVALSYFKALGLSHVRVDLSFERDDFAQRIERAATLVRALGHPIELALHFTHDPESEAVALAACLEKAALPIARFLVFRKSERSVSAQTVAAVRNILVATRVIPRVAGGTDGSFVEINRSRPPCDLIDAVTFSATPQVHTFDTTAIMENLPGLRETLLAAAQWSPGKEIIISPLTLRPRKKPNLPEKDGGYDDRQSTQFAAAWLAGAFAYCTAGNAASVTIGDLYDPDVPVSQDGALFFPLYFPLALVATHAGAPAECRFSSSPSQVIGLVWLQERRYNALVINLSGKPCRVMVSGLPEHCGSVVLDNTTWETVRCANDPLLESLLTDTAVKKGMLALELAPFSVTRLAGSQ